MAEIVNLEGEIWKPVVGFEGKYEVSNMGRVKSLNYLGKKRTSILKLVTDTNGYLIVRLFKDRVSHTFRVHRLVYSAFVKEVPAWNATGRGNDRMEINHINEVKTDNRIGNLELVNHTQNMIHSKWRIAAAHHKKIYQYNINKQLVRILNSIKEGQKYGFNPASISRCCKHTFGKNGNIYKGFVWSYVPIN